MLLAACLSGVALIGTWGSTQQAPTFAADVAGPDVNAKEYTQIAAAFGAVIGTIVAALMGDWFGRLVTYCLMCIGSLAIVPLFYNYGIFDWQFLALAWLLGA